MTLTTDGNTLFGRRFDASFAPLDAAIAGYGSELATVNALPLDSSVSADSEGNSLLLFQDESVTHFGYAIHGVLVHNDGLATPVASGGSGGTPGNGGTSGGESTSAAGMSGAPSEPEAGASGQSDSEASGGSANASGASAQAGSDAHAGHSNNAGSAAIGASNDDGGTSANAGASPSSDKKDDQSGCACRAAGSMRSSPSALSALALLGLALARRGRSRRSDKWCRTNQATKQFSSSHAHERAGEMTMECIRSRSYSRVRAIIIAAERNPHARTFIEGEDRALLRGGASAPRTAGLWESPDRS